MFILATALLDATRGHVGHGDAATANRHDVLYHISSSRVGAGSGPTVRIPPNTVYRYRARSVTNLGRLSDSVVKGSAYRRNGWPGSARVRRTSFQLGSCVRTVQNWSFAHVGHKIKVFHYDDCAVSVDLRVRLVDWLTVVVLASSPEASDEAWWGEPHRPVGCISGGPDGWISRCATLIGVGISYSSASRTTANSCCVLTEVVCPWSRTWVGQSLPVVF